MKKQIRYDELIPVLGITEVAQMYVDAQQAWDELQAIPSYTERYTHKRITAALQRLIVASSRAAMLSQYQETGERYEFCKGCGKPLQGYFNQCNQYPVCIKR